MPVYFLLLIERGKYTDLQRYMVCRSKCCRVARHAMVHLRLWKKLKHE